MIKGAWLGVAGLVALLNGCGREDSTGPKIIPDSTPPPAPVNLRIEKIGDGEIWLNWTPVEENRCFYVVYRAEEGGQAAAADSLFNTRFQDWNLDYEVEYTYQVTAVDSAGNESAPSRPVKGQPFNTLSPLPPAQARAMAHNISILAQLDIVLDWQANEETDLVNYRVYRGTAPDFMAGNPVPWGAPSANGTADAETPVAVFFYLVRATDGVGESSE